MEIFHSSFILKPLLAMFVIPRHAPKTKHTKIITTILFTALDSSGNKTAHTGTSCSTDITQNERMRAMHTHRNARNAWKYRKLICSRKKQQHQFLNIAIILLITTSLTHRRALGKHVCFGYSSPCRYESMITQVRK